MRSLSFATAFLITFAFASPATTSGVTPGRVALQARRGEKTGSANFVAADRARIERLKSEAAPHKDGLTIGTLEHEETVKHKRGAYSINATNAVVTYTVSVEIGGVARDLIVDTGSGNTWCGAQIPYNGTGCKGLFEVSYGSGYATGKECVNTVTLSPDLVIESQSFGVATYSEGFSTDGVLGIGPPTLTAGTSNAQYIIPTVTNMLYRQGTIQLAAVGISFAPTGNLSVTNGELTFGGIDESRYASNLSYTPLTTTQPSAKYWGVDQSVGYGNTTIMNLTAGIVDTGTTLTYLSTDAYNAYVVATGAVYDDSTGLLEITEEQYETLEPLVFNIGSAGSFVLSPNAQIWPRALNTAINGSTLATYLIIADVGEVYTNGLDFVLGYTFLERFYTVYDATNSRFGIAPTEFTDADIN